VCGTPHWRNPKPCSGALVTREGRLLLLRRAIEPWLGCWDIPGGFCEPGEHPADTARREVREETGLRVRLTGLHGIWMDAYGPPAACRPPETTMNVYYHAVDDGPEAPEPTIDPAEVTEVGWFAPSKLPEALAFPGHIPAMLAAWRGAALEGRLGYPVAGLGG
jgi:ADP-ribose pyrophosphatase YjhB (NUDIX family)